MRKWIMGCALLVTLMFPNTVFAATDNKICVVGSVYDVVSHGSKVNVDEVTSENIRNKSTLSSDYFKDKKELGADSAQFKEKYQDIVESDYAIDATSLHMKCNKHFGSDGKFTWTSCPVASQYSGENALYSIKKIQAAIGEFQFDQASGSFYTDIKDNFNSNLLVRVVRNGKKNEENYDYNSALAMGIIAPGESYEVRSNNLRLSFQKDENVLLEFYLRPDGEVECSGAYLGNVDSKAPSYANIPNPWKDSQICKSFQSGYSYISTNPTNYKKLLVPECYNDTIDYFDNTITEQSIRQKIANLERVFSNENTADMGRLQCHYHTDGSREIAGQTKSFIYNPSGSTSSDPYATGDYWAASCKETVTVDYDQPKKLNAGTGFTYSAHLTVTRTCTPIAIRSVTKPIQCGYRIECWGGPANHHGEGGAGPNEDFDACVNTCDGGTYTKECINQCYSKVYEGKNIDLKAIRGVKQTFLDVIQARQMASSTLPDCSTQHKDSPNYCYAQKGWPTAKMADGKPMKTALGSTIFEVAASSNHQSNCHKILENHCESFHGILFGYYNTCNSTSNPTMCYEVYMSKARPYCSDNPELDWELEQNIADEEYRQLLDAIRSYEKTENFEMRVTDSYKTNNGKPLVTTSTSLENMVTVDSVEYPAETLGTSQQGGKEVPTIQVKKEYTINLPHAVVDQLTGKEKYVTNDYQRPKNERDGGNKYYTDINSGTYNDYRKWYNNYSPLDERSDAQFVGNNIGVVFKNVGTVQSSAGNGVSASYTWDRINLDCFYGLLNKRYIECDDGICDLDCDDGDICTGGLQYMFRQINLDNVFPERNPRWNWNYTTETDAYGYASRPKEVTEDIEALGNSAFSSENLDYEITITKENIREIRRYNKSQKNYQNYDMDCSLKENGLEICESKMLKNQSLVNQYQRNTEIGSND